MPLLMKPSGGWINGFSIENFAERRSFQIQNENIYNQNEELLYITEFWRFYFGLFDLKMLNITFENEDDFRRF